MKTHPEVLLDLLSNADAERLVLSGVEGLPRVRRPVHPGMEDFARVVFPNEQSHRAIDLATSLSGHNDPVPAQVIKNNC